MRRDKLRKHMSRNQSLLVGRHDVNRDLLNFARTENGRATEITQQFRAPTSR
jgi:hypothetical protein